MIEGWLMSVKLMLRRTGSIYDGSCNIFGCDFWRYCHFWHNMLDLNISVRLLAQLTFGTKDSFIRDVMMEDLPTPSDGQLGLRSTTHHLQPKRFGRDRDAAFGVFESFEIPDSVTRYWRCR